MQRHLEVSKLKLKKGNALVVKLKDSLSSHEQNNVATAIKKVLNMLGFEPDDIPIIILEGGIDIEILEK